MKTLPGTRYRAGTTEKRRCRANAPAMVIAMIKKTTVSILNCILTQGKGFVDLHCDVP